MNFFSGNVLKKKKELPHCQLEERGKRKKKKGIPILYIQKKEVWISRILFSRFPLPAIYVYRSSFDSIGLNLYSAATPRHLVGHVV